MKTSLFSRTPLAVAVLAACTTTCSVAAAAFDITAASHASFSPIAVVAFGGHAGAAPDGVMAAVATAPAVLPADVRDLDPSLSTHMLATLNSSALPLAPDEALTFDRLFNQGSPVLLHMDDQSPEGVLQVSQLFGIAPSTSDVIVRKQSHAVEVFTSSGDDAANPKALLHALANTEHVFTEEADDPDPGRSLPGRFFNFNLVDPRGALSGGISIHVVRSKTASADFKIVTITTVANIAPRGVGVMENPRPRPPYPWLRWTTWLPVKYHLSHVLKAFGAEAVYVAHFPHSDGRTEFTQTDTETRGFSIGARTGAEISQSGKPDEILAAKLPFELTAGYEHTWQSNLTMQFKDYSLEAVPSSPSVTWNAMLSPKLGEVFYIKRGTTRPIEDRVTPMMRSATFQTMSQWKLPGEYKQPASVFVLAGYDLRRWDWHELGGGVKSSTVKGAAIQTFLIDMGSPHLSAETTVQIRSAAGSGACLRDNAGVADLAPCLATDRRQLWGLDAASRYVNRASGLCLTARPATRSVVTESCANVTNEKQWQWRGDRLHALSNHTKYRLYVAGGQVHLSFPGQLPDFPANFSHPALEPWTNYPAAPRQGIDLVVGSAGTRPLDVGREYAGFRAVSDDQRWRIEVLRDGL
jgi:hypothetical protein